MKLRLLLLPVILSAAACQGDDLNTPRETVKYSLLDPDSAQFKDEKIRRLWSSDGSRLTVYCAKVNASNLMGGKTGYKPVTVVVDAVHKPGTPKAIREIWSKDKIFINDAINPNYYLDCIRPDTQRANGKLFEAYITMGRPWNEGFQAQIDSEYPVLSTDEAPE